MTKEQLFIKLQQIDTEFMNLIKQKNRVSNAELKEDDKELIKLQIYNIACKIQDLTKVYLK